MIDKRGWVAQRMGDGFLTYQSHHVADLSHEASVAEPAAHKRDTEAAFYREKQSLVLGFGRCRLVGLQVDRVASHRIAASRENGNRQYLGLGSSLPNLITHPVT